MAEISSKNGLDAISGNEFNEKNVTAMQRSKYLAGVVTQKIHTDNEAEDLECACHSAILTSFHQQLSES